MQLREQNLARLMEQPLDVLVIGGGINGAVSAAALAGQGANVGLIDQRDFAGFTSQHSSNLAWGGIKYMETFEFGLVRQLCMSRNDLIASYPSSVKEIRFFAAIRKGFRHHPLKLWLGTWLYWLIGNGATRVPRLLSVSKIRQQEPLIDTTDCLGGFEYSDAYLFDNDARFVFNFIRAAMDHGGAAANYVSALACRREDDIWLTDVRDLESGREFRIQSRVLINAAGPFVDTLNHLSNEQTDYRHVYSKGIHLIVDRITEPGRVLTFFADDGRLFFVIPMGAKTCIGTTDTRVDSPLTEVSDEDRRFVLDNINHRLNLAKPLSVDDIIAERYGVRPLAVKGNGSSGKDFFQLSRKHAVEVDRKRAHLSIFGGKLTDCINVGDEVCGYAKEMGVALPRRGDKWYGEPNDTVKADFFQRAEMIRLDQLTPLAAEESLSQRLWRRYGVDAFGLLDVITDDSTQADVLLGGKEFLRCEVELTARREMIVKLEDFLRRRSLLAQTTRLDELKQDEGLLEVCTILFGHNRAQEKFDEFFAQTTTGNHYQNEEVVSTP